MSSSWIKVLISHPKLLNGSESLFPYKYYAAKTVFNMDNNKKCFLSTKSEIAECLAAKYLALRHMIILYHIN